MSQSGSWSTSPSRRDALKIGVLAGAGVALGGWSLDEAAAQELPLITKPIPSSGQRIPVVGLGTNAYNVKTPEEMVPLGEVLKRMPEIGLILVDTAPAYGRAEAVIGELVAKIGNRDKLFLATKVSAPNDDVAQGKAMLEESFKRLRTDHIDLIQVHNLIGVDVMMPVLQELKAQKKIKYIGITTFDDKEYPLTMDLMRKHPFDFIQVDYSIDNRNVEAEVLPLAQERKMGVMLNVPFGGRRGSLFKRVANRPLPEWAAEVDAKSWAQFFLKYSVSHPAVTCAIPGTTDVAHLEDNMGGARGRLADAGMRKRMEQFWETVG